MERLEITIFNKSEITSDTEEFRIDSEYYKKEYLKLYKYISASPIIDKLVYMSDLSTNGSFATVAAIKNDSNPKTIPFIRSGNVGDTFINESDLEFISKEAHNNLPKSTTHLHDIMMARKGKIGGASIITEDEIGFNCNENVIKLDILDKRKLNPFYFTAYFNSKFGIKQIERLSTGNVQPWVSIFQIRKLLIPFLNPSFQNEIEKVLTLSHSHRKQSKLTYSQAETLLLQEIGLNEKVIGLNPVEVINTNVKGFKESFGITGRLDAEYYQKKYEIIESVVKKNGFYHLKDVFHLLSNPSPSSYTDVGLKVVKTKNIRIPNVEIDDITDHTNEDRILVEKSDLLFASMGVGSLGRLSYIDTDIKNCTTDGTIRIFRTKEEFKNLNLEIPSLLFLTSQYGQSLIYKYVIGSTGIISISKENVENLIIPTIDKYIAKQLTSMVIESQNLKKQSKHLLEVAKKAVEVAIEESEEVAIRFINENIK